MGEDIVERYLAGMVYNLACDVIPLFRKQRDTCWDECRLVAVANGNFERCRLVVARCSCVEVEVDCCHSGNSRTHLHGFLHGFLSEICPQCAKLCSLLVFFIAETAVFGENERR